MGKSDFELTVKMHQGKTLMATAKTYPSLLGVIKEVVQNGIDSGASRIDVVINIPKRTWSVYDNGIGCGKEKFQKALHSINDSMKTPDKYGQFGRGLVAPLAIAEWFGFTSCASPSRTDYYEYLFVGKDIEQQDVVKIPGSKIDSLEFNPEGSLWWRTKVEAHRLSKDRHLTSLTLNQLQKEIALHFGEAIRSRSIVISIKLTDQTQAFHSGVVVAPEYSGQKLDVFETDGKSVGKIIMEFYLARLQRSGRKGQIKLGSMGNPSRLSMDQFLAQASKWIHSDICKDLKSGIFEGDILCENIALNPDRTRFDENDSFVELCDAIEKWHKKFGKGVVKDLREKDEANRYQQLGTAVMPFAELMIKQAQFIGVVGNIKIGTVGKQHVPPSRKDVVGVDEGKSISNSGGSSGGSRESGSEGGKDTPETEHKGHRPGPVYGGKGQRRTEVKGSSTSLRFEFVEMQDTKTPYVFNGDNGMLSVNVDHPNWTLCEDTDTTLIEYQVAVVTSALSLEVSCQEVSPQIAEVLRMHAFRSLEVQVFAIMNSKPMLKK